MSSFKKVYDFYNHQTGESVTHVAYSQEQEGVILDLFYEQYAPDGFELFHGTDQKNE
ncbi:Na+-translocating ferredoxin:NAD+ oxidoreductase RnfG subunit [Evansella vedderi]|uniref:Na+-translocating ferredoxin:NAD+ oxidoreductase RnfG subunit n=1 Tax=Evansella vedderi TaxID=38282 RepID=A0ABT9ZW92_9BACI|nr:hypothetical protein [Evansella vedderi]MDQ0255502.1 Na+-translocating ferredoxin:NAD+ oxidoreductase RnfG subunit [Evansella vedderi]